MTRVSLRFLFGVISLLVFFSCTSTRNLAPSLLESNCYVESEDIERDSSIYQFDEINPLLYNHFTERSIHLAHAIGVTQDLLEYIHLLENAEKTMDYKINLLTLRSKILQQINIASLEISSVVAELDCEEERVEQFANYFDQIERRVENRFTIAAIITGATGAITAGLLATNGNDVLAEQVGMATGVAEAFYGAYMIFYKRPSIEFMHDRNVLSDIWLAPKVSFLYPPSVWYYMNYTPKGSSTNLNKLETLKRRWRNLSDLNGENKEVLEIIEKQFGKGGKFTADDFFTRSNMIDQLEAQITLMKQDLVQLAIEIQGLD